MSTSTAVSCAALASDRRLEARLSATQTHASPRRRAAAEAAANHVHTSRARKTADPAAAGLPEVELHLTDPWDLVALQEACGARSVSVVLVDGPVILGNDLPLELYGLVQEVPQRETTPFYPRSPYAVAKQYAYWIVVNYREAYGMHASNGILFNHESPRRGPTFVTRKVTRAVARISKGLQAQLFMGNIDAKRDWGHARDYVQMMWMMMQQEVPDDYVVATGETNTVRSFIETAFKCIGIDVEWRGEGVKEEGYDASDPTRVLVKIDEKYFRPTEVELLIGDPTKAKQKLGWVPKIKMEALCKEMVECDIALVEKGDMTS